MTHDASTPAVRRDVARIETPSIRRGYSDVHLARPLVEATNWIDTDPFLILMEDWFPAGVFDKHPHRGIETVTYVIDGEVEHYDNHGNKGIIGTGDVQWMTAGRGVIHNEQPMAGLTVHSLQLWIVLPQADKLVPAHYQMIHADDVPVRTEPGAELRVFSGASGGVVSPTTNHAAVTMVEIRLEPGVRVEQGLPAGYNGFVILLEGTATIGTSARRMDVGQTAWLTRHDEPSSVSLTGGPNGVRAILYAGQPLGEPIAARGPFVMGTPDELDQGFREYRMQGERFGLTSS